MVNVLKIFVCLFFITANNASAFYGPQGDQAGVFPSAASGSSLMRIQAEMNGASSIATPRYSSFRTENASYQVTSGKTFQAQFMEIICIAFTSPYAFGVGTGTVDFANANSTTTPTGWDAHYQRGNVNDGWLAIAMGANTVANPKSTFNMANITFTSLEWPILQVTNGDANCVISLFGREI